MIGRRILHYEIVEMLGRGSTGIVYKARDTHLDRFIAIKVLSPEKVADADVNAAFCSKPKLRQPSITNILPTTTLRKRGIKSPRWSTWVAKSWTKIIGRKGLRLIEALR